ncbi:MAG: FTR1 family protein [Burkholderiaceae bacterium]|nr:FTR1 family protein [Burkholderiaceae bacterium]
MYATLMITFREGLEAFLIAAISAAYLRQTGRAALLAPLRGGVLAAVLASAALGVVLARIGSLTPATEGWLAAAAMVLVLGCTVHMLRHGKQMKGEIGKRLDALSGKAGFGAAAAVFLFALLMVGREGVETATMLASLASQGGSGDMVVGGTLGVVCAALMALAWTRYGRRVNLSRFFRVTAVFMVLFSLQLAIYAFHEFSEAGALPGLDNAWWHIATEPYGPEGVYGHWLTYGLLLVPAAFLAIGAFRDRAAPAATPRADGPRQASGPIPASAR